MMVSCPSSISPQAGASSNLLESMPPIDPIEGELGDPSLAGNVISDATVMLWEDEWIKWDAPDTTDLFSGRQNASKKSGIGILSPLHRDLNASEFHSSIGSPAAQISYTCNDQIAVRALERARSPPKSSLAVGRKRKSPGQDGDFAGLADQSLRSHPAKVRPHNIVERRYRANLNEKITELRDCIPSLRASDGFAFVGEDGGEGSFAATKRNKASVLSKATEYIRHLEQRNRCLEEENRALKVRLREVDKIVVDMATSTDSTPFSGNNTVSSAPSLSSSPPAVVSHSEAVKEKVEALNRVEGLIKVPPEMQKMRASSVMPRSYAQSYLQEERNSSAGGGGYQRRNYPGAKFMLGAIASLMVVEGMSNHKKAETANKGLMAVPYHWVTHAMSMAGISWSQAFLPCAWDSWPMRAILRFMVTAILVMSCAFVIFLYLFNSRPQSFRHTTIPACSDSTAKHMAPHDLRRQAWLTSMQRVGVPRHRFFVEWFAVTFRCCEYFLGCILGWKIYSWITGITEEDEKGRVKTWDIAIDAQLAGGDVEVSKSRLVLTIFAAGTLPRTPARMMLKALHCWMILWTIGEPGSFAFSFSNQIARLLANYQWSLARKMNRSLPDHHPDALSEHLTALLEIDCDEVMIPSILQRAANLTWNRSMKVAAGNRGALLDVVVDDPAIQSSLDALAAWWSSHRLQQALLESLDVESDEHRGNLMAQIERALNVSPRPSAAHTRALAMKAVFSNQRRMGNIQAVLSALPSPRGKLASSASTTCNFLDSSIPVSVREEIIIAARCAMIAAILEARVTDNISIPPSMTAKRAIGWLSGLSLDSVELTLIGLAAINHLLHIIPTYKDLSPPQSTSSFYLYSEMLSHTDSTDDERAGNAPLRGDLHPSSPVNDSQCTRVMFDIIHWARRAFNPTFSSLSNHLAEAIETECVAVCRG